MIDLFGNTLSFTNDNDSYVELRPSAPVPDHAAPVPDHAVPVSGAISPASPALPRAERAPSCERSEQSSTSIRPKGGTIKAVSSTSNRPKDDNYSDLVQATGVPPKSFQSFKENIDQIPARPKNGFDPRKKLQGKKVPAKLIAPPPEAITEQSTIRIHEGEEKGKSLQEWVDRPEWALRKKNPYLKGADANRKAIETINANVQSKKPDVMTVVPCGQGGRYDWEAIEKEALDHIANGGTLASYCKFAGMNYMTVIQHQNRHPDFKAQVVEARKQGADAIAAEALEIASTPMITEETIEVYNKDEELVNKSVKRADNVYARKLAFQARMQLLEKWAPEKYGPNVKGDEVGGMAEKLRAAQLRIRQANKERQRERREEISELSSRPESMSNQQ